MVTQAYRDIVATNEPLLGRRAVQISAGLLVLSSWFAWRSPYFLTATNLATMLANSVDLAIITLGMVFVLTMGGIDVSAGAIQGLAAVAVGRGLQAGLPGWMAALFGPLVGLGLGAWNGLNVARLRVPPIIATLAMMNILRGAIFLLVGGSWIAGLPDALALLTAGRILGLPVAAWLVGGLYLLGFLLLRLVPFGVHLHAVGSQESAASLVGVEVARVRILGYLISGLFAGIAATWYVARYRNVEINVGTTIFLDALAAAVLGGTSVLGGQANLLGALLGVLFVVVLRNGMVLSGIPSLWEQVVVGTLLVAVLSVDFSRTRPAKGRTGH